MLRSYCTLFLAVLPVVGLGLAADEKDNALPTKGVIETATKVAPPVGIISPQENDRRIARWLVVDNDSLIACGELAESHAFNAEVKELAKSVATDHKRVREILKTFTGSQIAARNPVQNRSAPENTATLLKDEGRSRNGRLAFQPTDFLEVKERVCRELHAKAEKEFRNLKGVDFDHAFVTHMLFGHEALVVTLEAVKGDATTDLQTTLNDLDQMSQKHLKELRRLHEKQRGAATESEAVTEAK